MPHIELVLYVVESIIFFYLLKLHQIKFAPDEYNHKPSEELIK